MKKVLPFILLFLLCGCAKFTEVDSLLIVSGIAVDLGEPGYRLTVEAVNVRSSDQNENMPVYIETTGTSLAEALSDIVKRDGEKLFFNHTRLILISSALLEKEGASHIVDSLNLESRFRSSVRLGVTEGAARDVIRAKTEAEPVTAFAMDKAAFQSAALLKAPDVPFFSFYNDLLEEGVDGVLPAFSATDDGEKKTPSLSGAVLFKKDAPVCALSPRETQFLLLLKRQVQDGVLILGDSVYKVIKSSPEIKCDGKCARFKLNAMLMLLEGREGYSEKTSENAEKGIEEGVFALFEKLKENGCDPLGLGKDLKRRYPSYWKGIYPRVWEKEYRELCADTDISVKTVESPKLAF